MKAETGIDFNAQKGTNQADGTNPSDSATWGQVQNMVNGVAWKDAVRGASTTNGTLASAFAAGSTLDGLTLATNDRILLKNQTAGAENGVYVVQASGAPVRATDFDASAELDGAAIYVTSGTTNADTAWTLTTDGPFTIGTTSLAFTRFGGGQTYTGSNGVLLTGTNFTVQNADSSIVVAGGGISTSRAAIGAPGKYTALLGAITGGTPLTVTHNLGSQYCLADVYEDNGTTQTKVVADIVLLTANTCSVTVGISQAANFYRIVVIG